MHDRHMPKFLAAQGDILIQQIDEAPEELTPVAAESGRLIVAHGESTGHHHSFSARSGMRLFREDGTGSLIGVTEKPVNLTHQEHSTIRIPAGRFRFIRQRTMQSGVVRRVID